VAGHPSGSQKNQVGVFSFPYLIHALNLFESIFGLFLSILVYFRQKKAAIMAQFIHALNLFIIYSFSI
jgi:hypothetical protein